MAPIVFFTITLRCWNTVNSDGASSLCLTILLLVLILLLLLPHPFPLLQDCVGSMFLTRCLPHNPVQRLLPRQSLLPQIHVYTVHTPPLQIFISFSYPPHPSLPLMSPHIIHPFSWHASTILPFFSAFIRYFSQFRLSTCSFIPNYVHLQFHPLSLRLIFCDRETADTLFQCVHPSWLYSTCHLLTQVVMLVHCFALCKTNDVVTASHIRKSSSPTSHQWWRDSPSMNSTNTNIGKCTATWCTTRKHVWHVNGKRRKHVWHINGKRRKHVWHINGKRRKHVWHINGKGVYGH